MDWEKVGEEIPVKNDNGQRLVLDENNEPRPVEMVPYEPLEDLEFDVDSFASAKDRRQLIATLDNLAAQKQFSPNYANDVELSFNTIIGRFIRAIREVDGGKEYRERDALRELNKRLDYDEVITMLYWLRGKCTLAASKKKNSKQSSD
jgi:hypothetical protein